MFLDHTQRCSTFGRTPLDEWSARRRDLYLTTHDNHNRQISMPRWDLNPRSQQASGPAARLLRSWVRIPSGAWVFVCCECRVLSGRGLCDELITRPEESYRMCCIVVCDLKTSRIGAPYIYDISNLRFNIVLNTFSRHKGKHPVNSIKERYTRQVDNSSVHPKIFFFFTFYSNRNFIDMFIILYPHPIEWNTYPHIPCYLMQHFNIILSSVSRCTTQSLSSRITN